MHDRTEHMGVATGHEMDIMPDVGVGGAAIVEDGCLSQNRS